MKAKQRKEQRLAFVVFAVAVVVAVLASVSGCVTRKACESRYGQCGFISPVRVEVERHDTTVITRERIVTDTFRVVRNFRTTDTVSTCKISLQVPRVHTSNGVRLQWINDSTLVASATCKSDTVRIKGQAVVKTITETKDHIVEVKGWNWYSFGAGALGMLVLGLMFLILVRR